MPLVILLCLNCVGGQQECEGAVLVFFLNAPVDDSLGFRP